MINSSSQNKKPIDQNSGSLNIHQENGLNYSEWLNSNFSLTGKVNESNHGSQKKYDQQNFSIEIMKNFEQEISTPVEVCKMGAQTEFYSVLEQFQEVEKSKQKQRKPIFKKKDPPIQSKHQQKVQAVNKISIHETDLHNPQLQTTEQFEAWHRCPDHSGRIVFNETVDDANQECSVKKREIERGSRIKLIPF